MARTPSAIDAILQVIADKTGGRTPIQDEHFPLHSGDFRAIGEQFPKESLGTLSNFIENNAQNDALPSAASAIKTAIDVMARGQLGKVEDPASIEKLYNVFDMLESKNVGPNVSPIDAPPRSEMGIESFRPEKNEFLQETDPILTAVQSLRDTGVPDDEIVYQMLSFLKAVEGDSTMNFSQPMNESWNPQAIDRETKFEGKGDQTDMMQKLLTKWAFSILGGAGIAGGLSSGDDESAESRPDNESAEIIRTLGI